MPEDAQPRRPFDVALCGRVSRRHDAMNSDRSLGVTLMTFRTRTWASRPCAHRPYTVAVVTPRCSATCLTDSNRSRPPWLASAEDPGPLVPRHKPDTKSLLNGASGGAEWELLSERFPMFSTACNPVLPPTTLAPDLPKLNVAGSNPVSRFQGCGVVPTSAQISTVSDWSPPRRRRHPRGSPSWPPGFPHGTWQSDPLLSGWKRGEQAPRCHIRGVAPPSHRPGG